MSTYALRPAGSLIPHLFLVSKPQLPERINPKCHISSATLIKLRHVSQQTCPHVPRDTSTWQATASPAQLPEWPHRQHCQRPAGFSYQAQSQRPQNRPLACAAACVVWPVQPAHGDMPPPCPRTAAAQYSQCILGCPQARRTLVDRQGMV